jgi:short subunit dehydrogenase-like uncharacterized protein
VKTFVIASRRQSIALRVGAPFAGHIGPRLRGFLERRIAARATLGPNEQTRAAQPWAVHVTARGAAGERQVIVRGRDVYGITAEIAALGAAHLYTDGYAGRGALAPSQAVPADQIFRDLKPFSVTVDY